MRITNMVSTNGNTVPNQFVVETDTPEKSIVFQSYDSTIAEILWVNDDRQITLDSEYWDYSKTTVKYLLMFLREQGSYVTSRQDIQDKIDSKEYTLENLN